MDSGAISRFFIAASAVMGAVTWFVINRDKKGRRRKSPQSIQENKAVEPKDKIAKNNIKDIWEIEDIRDGIIYLSGSRYTAILKLGSIDFGLLSQNEQETVENILIKTSLGFTYPVQFFSTTEYIDTTRTQQDIRAALESDILNPKLQTYAENVIRFLDDIMRKKSIYIRRNFLAVSYEGELDKAYRELARRCEIIASELSKARITAERMSSDEILNLIHSLLNKGASVKPSDVVKYGGFELYVTGTGLAEDTEILEKGERS